MSCSKIVSLSSPMIVLCEVHSEDGEYGAFSRIRFLSYEKAKKQLNETYFPELILTNKWFDEMLQAKCISINEDEYLHIQYVSDGLNFVADNDKDFFVQNNYFKTSIEKIKEKMEEDDETVDSKIF